MTSARCRWCGAPAIGTVTASGLASPIDYCDSDPCWEQCYKTVRGLLPRTWGPVKTAGRRATRQAGPDLFDLLPGGKETA